MFRRGYRWFRLAAPAFMAWLAAACAPDYTLVSHTPSVAEKSNTFGYRRWVSPKAEPDVVVIGIHGFCGASIDYENLGLHMLKRQPRTAVYAYEVRGQGSDPLRERRGDIGDPREWYRDLLAFTQLVRERHPRAKVVWFGESMGGLIAAHALHESAGEEPPCDALVLSSPVVRFREDVPVWKRALVQVAAVAAPNARVSLDAFTGGQDIQMTQQSTHSEQAETNAYHIERHTLRLLAALGRHIDGMNACAEAMPVPVLVLHGEKDFFNDDGDIRGFVARIPPDVPKAHRHYRGAYHLLMYDERREDVFRDVARWLNRLRRGRL